MRLFSNIFKPKPKTTFETKLGIFTLVYSKRNKNLWSNNNSEVSLTVQGTETEPNPNQIEFLGNHPTEINRLDTRITKRFKSEFEEVSLPVDFNSWRDRFKIVAVEVMLLTEKEAYWNITFEELKEDYAHFTLYIEGEKLTDFSIDT